MGYRSDMGWAMLKVVQPFFIKACLEVSKSSEAFFKEPLDESAEEIVESEEQVLYIWKGIKAYDTDSVRRCFQSLMDDWLANLPREDPLRGFDSEELHHLLHLGESYNDPNEFGGLDDDFSLSCTRQLTWDS